MIAKPAVVQGRASFEQSSANIQTLFADSDLAVEITAEIRAAYEALDDEPPVAVRSSANAEDLPGLSFAGQQETFLNVTGADAVVAAVKNCWASLWTAQAISYRHQNGIEQDSVAMAVVVQMMVPSEVSGILFTANPATGERNEIIINASFGLGEAVVSGQVTPDTYIIDKTNKSAKETILGPKEQKIVADGEQGVRMEDVSDAEREQSSLSDDMLTELIETVLKIEALYDGLPQDIEWAFSKGKLHLLQSRPITNLPVQPIEVEWIPTPPAKTLVRRQIVENMPDPVCPLFEQLYLTEGLEMPRKDRSVMVGGGPLFVTMNGFAYQRADWPQLQPKKVKESKEVTDADLEEQENTIAKLAAALNTPDDKVAEQEKHDMELMVADLSEEDRNMDFVEPTQIEDPSALFATIKAMVQDDNYDPKNQAIKAKAIREQKFAEVSKLLSGMEYWQFRYRWWLGRKYNYIREEVAFYFGYTWKVLRPMAAELGRRMVEAGTFLTAEDTYFLVTDELDQAIAARKSGNALPELGRLAAERRDLREARKRHHPPGTVPKEASNVPGIKFKETQIVNDESSDTMRGFAVSSGRITAAASVIAGPAEFDKMAPGSILVSPLTTPAWTQLFAHAVGLVTDMGSILAHGSIVAREYGIPAVLGVGNGTKRIEHGQMITIDGDAGTVEIHEQIEETA